MERDEILLKLGKVYKTRIRMLAYHREMAKAAAADDRYEAYTASLKTIDTNRHVNRGIEIAARALGFTVEELTEAAIIVKGGEHDE